LTRMRHMKLDDAKYQLCQQAWELSEPCDAELLTKIFHAAKFPGSKHDDLGIDSGPILYILFVAVFYLAVVAMLVGSNMKRNRRAAAEEDADKVQVVDYSEQFGTRVRVLDPNSMEEEEGPLSDPV